MRYLIILFVLISQISIAQDNSVKKVIEEINIQEDTIKAVFDWMANNIRYDVSKMEKIRDGNKTRPKGKPMSYAEHQKAKLETVIKRKKGVCEDYTVLFDAVVRQLGYQSQIIEGYTKNSKGKIQRKIGHTWNAVKVNGAWKLYDPTWGAGYVKDEKKFIRAYNAQWYDVDPIEMIKTHMPFDPMWQLLNSPYSYAAFEKGNDVPLENNNIDYNEVINLSLAKNAKERLNDQLERSEAMGDGIRLVQKWKSRTKKRVDLFQLEKNPDLLNETNRKNNEALELFNKYIEAKNKRFKSKKWTKEYAANALEQIKKQMNASIGVYSNLEVQDPKTKRFISQSISKSEKLLKRVESELKFIARLKG